MSERGFGTVYLILGVVALAAVAGAWVYHTSVVAGLKSQISSLTAERDNLLKVNAQLSAENGVLRKENADFKVAVEKQNKAIDAALKERDDATAAYQKARAEAKSSSVVYERRISAILSEKQKEGELWHQTWSRQVRAYVKERQDEARVRPPRGALLDGLRGAAAEAGDSYGLSASRGQGAGEGEVFCYFARRTIVVDGAAAFYGFRPRVQPGSPG